MKTLKIELTQLQFDLISDWAYDEFQNMQEELEQYPEEEDCLQRKNAAEDLLNKLNEAEASLEDSYNE